MAEKTGKGLRDAAGLVLLTGACACTGAVIGAAGHFYNTYMTPGRPVPRRGGKKFEKEFAEGSSWIKNHPQREDVYIRADDGLQMHGSYIPAEPVMLEENPAAGPESASEDGKTPAQSVPEHRFAVCVHGFADSSDGMGLYAAVYYDRYGMNVLLPDLRGHGRSDGDYVGMGYDDSRDILRWIDWILEKDPAAQIVLHGVSLGAAAVLMTTGYSLPKQVVAAVADSSYTSAMDLYASVYSRVDKKLLPASAMMEAVRALEMVRAGYDLAKASPIQAAACSSTPTLFIQGQEDDFVPPRMMPALYKAASCPKAFQWIPEAGHGQAVNADPETYWARIERFLHAGEVDVI